MPNRILKESICTSDNVDKLSLRAEIAFYRLIVNCDDYGRFDGRPSILKARLFPLKKETDVNEGVIESILKELVAADLIILYEVRGKPYLQMRTWEDHQQVRAKKSKYPEPERNENKPSDNSCNQLISDDIKSSRNPIQSESLSESESLSSFKPFDLDDDLQGIAREHDKLLSAAESAGFPRTDAVRAKLIALYADHGMEKMLSAIDACVDHGATNIAYLQAVLRGEPKKPKAQVAAQAYGQRDYSKEQEDAMRRMLSAASGKG